MDTKLKFWIFERYFSIAVVIAIVAVIIVSVMTWYFSSITNIGFLLTVAGSLFSFIFFMQKQQHEELNTFKALFTEFNQRYDELNEKLNKIRDADENTPLSPCEKDILYQYFNLCGEEYLFYQKGYIYPCAWKAWCNGMKYFLEKDRIGNLWEEEEKEEYYYGLTRRLIWECAVPTCSHS